MDPNTSEDNTVRRHCCAPRVSLKGAQRRRNRASPPGFLCAPTSVTACPAVKSDPVFRLASKSVGAIVDVLCLEDRDSFADFPSSSDVVRARRGGSCGVGPQMCCEPALDQSEFLIAKLTLTHQFSRMNQQFVRRSGRILILAQPRPDPKNQRQQNRQCHDQPDQGPNQIRQIYRLRPHGTPRFTPSRVRFCT